ncbi:hypothetical protein L345_08829, partial [Ophiophagus hannah]
MPPNWAYYGRFWSIPNNPPQTQRRAIIPSLSKSSNVHMKISNEVPEHPCLSPVSNHVYERRLIEKYIAENGTDPVNNQPLSEEQLLDIK